MQTKKHNFPPLLNKDFLRDNLQWTGMDDINFEVIGKVLSYHLIAEHYLDRFLQAKGDKIAWDSVNLSFAQKVKLAFGQSEPWFKGEDPALRYCFAEGLGILNSLRNTFSHNIEAKIDNKKIKQLFALFRKGIRKGEKSNITTEAKMPSDLEVIETFVFIFCAHLGVYFAKAVSEHRGRRH